MESGVAFTGATNAGTYVISAVIVIDDADNRNLPALSATLKINKATAVIDVSGVQTVYTYNGSLQTVSGGATASSGQQVKYANNTFTTVAEGNGKVVEVYVEESTNYVAHSEYVTITVNKATAVIRRQRGTNRIHLQRQRADGKQRRDGKQYRADCCLYQ